jgi:hypothetical protein
MAIVCKDTRNCGSCQKSDQITDVWLKTHPPPPSLDKRRGATALPSLFEREGLGQHKLSAFFSRYGLSAPQGGEFF